MAYDEKLAERIRAVLDDDASLTEKTMFGGICFLQNGKMFCGVVGDELMVRVGPERYESSLEKPHVRTMDFTGRPMTGYVFVEAPGCHSTKLVSPWVTLARSFVDTLPAKKAKTKPKRKRSA